MSLYDLTGNKSVFLGEVLNPSGTWRFRLLRRRRRQFRVSPADTPDFSRPPAFSLFRARRTAGS